MEPVNPFNLTKATEFNDRQIVDYWVDNPDGGFAPLVKPTSLMPMLILGGKGSGKTHLMRFFSFEAKLEVNPDDVQSAIVHDGYIGTYFRCRGLNAFRFSGKGQSDDLWQAVFAYYMDLWLCQLLLENLQKLLVNSNTTFSEREFLDALAPLLSRDSIRVDSLAEAIDRVDSLRRALDIHVNNSAITKDLSKVDILTNPGDLLFQVPQFFCRACPELQDIAFVYLIDELENLTKLQQRYINTLVREREAPCTFKIGARLYGIKTYETLSAGEENKEGSEFEILFIDNHWREHQQEYHSFCVNLVRKRLSEAGYGNTADELFPHLGNLPSCFAELGDEVAYFDDRLRQKYSDRERPYWRKFRACMYGYDDIDSVISILSFSGSPYIDRALMFCFYKKYRGGENPVEVASWLCEDCQKYLASKDRDTYFFSQIDKFGKDILAQLLVDCSEPQVYYGFSQFVKISDGLPRNLLIVLKNIFRWAVFYGETPFSDTPISIDAQSQGMQDSSEWFYNDARIAGPEGNDIRSAIRRISTLLKEIRFSDKPSECSCVSFNGSMDEARSDTRDIIELAEKWSMIVRFGERKDKNSKTMLWKYRLSPMLSAMWDLPIYNRGSLTLGGDELDAVFCPGYHRQFTDFINRRISRMRFSYSGSPVYEFVDELGIFGESKNG